MKAPSRCDIAFRGILVSYSHYQNVIYSIAGPIRKGLVLSRDANKSHKSCPPFPIVRMAEQPGVVLIHIWLRKNRKKSRQFTINIYRLSTELKFRATLFQYNRPIVIKRQDEHILEELLKRPIIFSISHY